METDKNFVLYLCNFGDQVGDTNNEVVSKLWSGDWSIGDHNIIKELLLTGLETEQLLNELKRHQGNADKMEKILHVAISMFLTYCSQNWSPQEQKFELATYLGAEWPKDIDVSVKLQRDSEPIYVNIVAQELLYFSSQIFAFAALYSLDSNMLHLWWLFRSKVAHQIALEDTSAALYSELELLMAKLTNELQGLHERPRLQLLLCLEIAQGYLVYSRLQRVENYLLRARELAGLKLELTGILGKRTKYQQNMLPQLALSSSLDSNVARPSSEESHGASDLPQEIELQDDVRLNKIQYSEKISQAELPSLEQTLCLLTVQYLQKAQPKDDLINEELQPYIEAVLSQKSGPWSTRVAALLIRCKLEANQRRTVERAMLQCETVVTDETPVSNTSRLSYLWASGLQPAWTWRQALADLYLSLGLTKAALEHYQALQLWEDVIVCYTALRLRHKAAEVIRQQIEANPTVKLYCLLGEATDDITCYEKAWELSNYQSSRAQRHWGDHLFDHKQYEECLPHYEKSVEINSIQEGVWLSLGYAALMTEKWELSAKAYRRYTYLQPNTFEAWNNLAKAYLNQGNKERAYGALMEAVRYAYQSQSRNILSNLWENLIIVSLDTGHVEDAMWGFHHLLNLKRECPDMTLLRVLVASVLKDEDNARLRMRVLEWFRHATAAHPSEPELWRLYSDLSPNYFLRTQRLLQAYRGFTQSGNWPNSPETCKSAIDLAQSLLEYSLKLRLEAEDKDKVEADQQLSSARLVGQSVLRAAEKQDWPETKEAVKELKQLLNTVTEYMNSISII